MVKRHERKYRIEGMVPEAVQSVLVSHVLSFQKCFPDRQVNSIYLDTPELACYSDNLHGVQERAKFRIRWYGEEENGHIPKPIFEIKCKDGELGWKYIHKMGPLTIGPSLSQQIQQQFSDIGKRPETMESQPFLSALPSLQPTLVVRYQRSYFESYDQLFRLTLDWDLQFQAIEGRPFPGIPRRDNAVIVEIKYPLERDSEYDRVGQRLPFRIGKNSKYVTGMLMVGLV